MLKLFFILMLIAPPLTALQQHYGANEHSALWSHSGDVYRCRLAQTIPQYGSGTFIREAGRSVVLQYQLQSSEQVVGEVALQTTPPPWRHTRSGRVLDRIQLPNPLNHIHFKGPPAAAALAEMVRGMNPAIQYQRGETEPVHITASLVAIALQPAYGQFLECIDQLYPSLFEDVAFSNIYFDTNQHTLTPAHKVRLDQLVAYIKADAKVISVQIDGHTDIRGFSLFNHRLGKKRATAVHEYLISQGIDTPRVGYRVRNFGEYKEQAPNDTPERRAKNRVATVTLATEHPEPDPVDDTFVILTGTEAIDTPQPESIFETPLPFTPPPAAALPPTSPGLVLPRIEVPPPESEAPVPVAESEPTSDIPKVNLLPLPGIQVTSPLVAPPSPAELSPEPAPKTMPK